ncbi:hypothetical protein SAMN05216330_11488 [Bradyrhizobium sp. Ghvi]|uniref:hypothetical protein n=1 Tax=Bradyrhizobium sp. Ghvi TaxID=1855319 RepID=UPI0008EED585|nr:hypothetical protein [Bradyrhizobium sp. Ghvi]SFQ06312.1 hypothetical protein SAMN05216330_11488 [Bradyrhizobium sp. Ghvi]
MKVVARLIDLIAAFCIQQYWHCDSAQSDALSRTSIGEQSEATVECLPLKLGVENNDLKVPPPR